MYNYKKTNQDITNGERLQELLGIQIRDNKKIPTEFILFDLEAIGTTDSGDWMEIIEIGAYKVRLKEQNAPVMVFADFGNTKEFLEYPEEYSIEVVDSYHSYVKPVFHPNIPKRLSKLIHLDKEQWNEIKHTAPEFPTVINEFIDWAGQDSVFVSWSSSDEDMIFANCDNNYVYDLPELAFLDLQYEYDSFKNESRRTGLGLAMEEQGIEFEGMQHTALDDSYNMLHIFEKMITEHGPRFTLNNTRDEVVAGRA